MWTKAVYVENILEESGMTLRVRISAIDSQATSAPGSGKTRSCTSLNPPSRFDFQDGLGHLLDSLVRHFRRKQLREAACHIVHAGDFRFAEAGESFPSVVAADVIRVKGRALAEYSDTKSIC
jgi:hypothetical protein